MTEDLPILTSEDDWLDLNTGDKAIVRGKLDSAGKIGAKHLMVVFSDWSMQVINLIDEEGLDHQIKSGERVDIVITKAEDMLLSTSKDISIRE